MKRQVFCMTLLAMVVLSGMTVRSVYASDSPATESKVADDAKKGGEHGGEHIGEEGVNKNPSEFKTDLAIYTVVVFLLLLGILWKFAWGPIVAGLEKRDAGIRQNIADAEEARINSEKMLAEYAKKLDDVQEEIREIIAEARRDAEHTKQEILNAAEKESTALKDRSIAEIERARDQALTDLFDTMSSQVTTATEYVLGRSLSGDDQNRLVDEALAQFSQN